MNELMSIGTNPIPKIAYELTPKRRKPSYYVYDQFIVLGHYESTCGGCDNIGSASSVFSLITYVREKEIDLPILCEGLLLSEDVKWTSILTEEVVCLFLVTDIYRCISQIENRRKEAGNQKPFNTHNTVNRVKTIDKARDRLIAQGVKCIRCSASQVLRVVISLLKGQNYA